MIINPSLSYVKAKRGECEQAVCDAIDAGYRHIDTAYVYGNEQEVGNAVRRKIAEGVVKRGDMFVVTKVIYIIITFLEIAFI